MEELPQSPLQSKVLLDGPVLCLDIDGVCAPLGKTARFNIEAPPPGFTISPRRTIVQAHPALPGWLKELDRAFAHVAWISTWNVRCAGFASGFGADSAVNWPYLPNVEPPSHDALPWPKLEAVRQWIAPDQPVAFVDDHLVEPDPSEGWLSLRSNGVAPSVERIRKRPGPLLLVGPSKEIGLSRETVDLLCEFARDPNARQFEDRDVRVMHNEWSTQWPWPLDGHENPVALDIDNRREWEVERRGIQAARRQEIHAAAMRGEGVSR